MSDRSWTVTITTVLAASAPGPAFTPTAAAAEPPEPDAVFVDCSRPASEGVGSRLDPFRSLSQVNALTLAPGTRRPSATGTLGQEPAITHPGPGADTPRVMRGASCLYHDPYSDGGFGRLWTETVYLTNRYPVAARSVNTPDFSSSSLDLRCANDDTHGGPS